MHIKKYLVNNFVDNFFKIKYCRYKIKCIFAYICELSANGGQRSG